MKRLKNLRGMEEVEQRLSVLAQRLQPHLRGFYLAGGTAVMFRHHHRLSTDLDFFSYRWFSRERRLAQLRQHFTIERVYHGEDNLDIFIEGVKVSLVYFPYRNVEPVGQWQRVHVASNYGSFSNRGASHAGFGKHVHKPLAGVLEVYCPHCIPNKKRTPPFYGALKTLLSETTGKNFIQRHGKWKQKNSANVAFLHQKYRWDLKQAEKDFERKFEGQCFALALGALSHFDDYPDLPHWAKEHILNMVKAWRNDGV